MSELGGHVMMLIGSLCHSDCNYDHGVGGESSDKICIDKSSTVFIKC